MPDLAAHMRQSNEQDEKTVTLEPETWKRQTEAHAHTLVSRRLEMLLPEILSLRTIARRLLFGHVRSSARSGEPAVARR